MDFTRRSALLRWGLNELGSELIKLAVRYVRYTPNRSVQQTRLCYPAGVQLPWSHNFWHPPPIVATHPDVPDLGHGGSNKFKQLDSSRSERSLRHLMHAVSGLRAAEDGT